MLYCDPSDVYQYGVPAGSIPNPSRLVDEVDVTDNTITLGDHGLEDDQEVVLRAESGGTMPAPLDDDTTYFAIVVNEHRFSLAASAGGSVIDLTTAGSRLVLIPKLPMAAAIRWASRVLDEEIPAHAMPLSEGATIPEVLRITAAELAGWKLTKHAGGDSRTVGQVLDEAQKRIARWAKGIPMRDPNAPSRTNLAASASAPYRDRRGWSQYGGIS